MTFKDKSINKLYAFAMAAVFALVLAGCGGGGGGTAEDPTLMPTPQEMCVADKGEGSVIVDGMCYSATEHASNMCAAAGGRYEDDGTCTSADQIETEKRTTAQNAAMRAYEAAKAALAAVMDDASHDMDSYAMAEEALNEAKAANAVAQAATTSANAEAAQALVETARDNVVMYAGMVTAAATKAAERVVQEAANAVAMTKADAIKAEAAQLGTAASPDAGLGGGGGVDADDAAVPAATTYSMTIERDRMGTTVKIADTAMAEDDDPQFMQAEDLGGGTTMHVRDNGMGVEEVVVVSTDIETPKAVAFAKFEEDLAGTLSQTLNVRKDGVTVDADNPADSFDVSAAISTVADRLSNIMAAGFSSSGGGTLTYPADNSATDDKDEAFEATGTYNGAMGTYRCAASSGTCSVTYDAEGKISAIGTDWIFTPAEGATSDQLDYDYYNYGFWLKKTTDEDGVLTYNEVETFAGSSVAASGDVSSVLGSATYEGGATGVYVKNVYNSDRTIDTATSGHFTADVNLMAYFGGNDVAVSNQNSIKGTIDNFTLSGGEEQMWSVAVEGDIAASGGTASGTAKGGDGDGSFSATFHGDVTAAADGTVPQPGSVVGEFNAGFTDGSVAGGFGARRKMME